MEVFQCLQSVCGWPLGAARRPMASQAREAAAYRGTARQMGPAAGRAEGGVARGGAHAHWAAGWAGPRGRRGGMRPARQVRLVGGREGPMAALAAQRSSPRDGADGAHTVSRQRASRRRDALQTH